MRKSDRNPEAVLRKLEWSVIRRLDGMLSGDYRTLFRGFGLDLADLREYRFGDDVRQIDWNVTARLDTPYVREYNEDRDISAWFLLDLSPSVDFGSGSLRKRTMLVDFTALLARILTRHGNRIGAVVYGNTIDSVIPARGGRLHVLHLIDVLSQAQEFLSGGETDLSVLLEAGELLLSRRSLVFIVSDFFSAPGWEPRLARLSLRHEVLAVRISDPLESSIPDMGIVMMEDAETGEQMLVDTHDPGFRKRFEDAAKVREESLAGLFRNSGTDLLEISTEADLADTLVRYAERRSGMKRRGIRGAPVRPSGGTL